MTSGWRGWLGWTSIAAIGVTMAGTAAAQVTGSRATRAFLSAAAQSDQFEIVEAQIVLTQSKDDELRAFASRMLEEHRRSTAVLKRAAMQEGLTPPEMGIADDQSRLLAALQSLTGPDFDKAYARQQILAHRSALATNQIYAASGDDATLRGVAKATTILIESHLAMIDRLAAMSGD